MKLNVWLLGDHLLSNAISEHLPGVHYMSHWGYCDKQEGLLSVLQEFTGQLTT